MASPSLSVANSEIRACCASLWEIMSPPFFRALADPRRLSILCWLASRQTPTSVSDVAACCPTDLSVVSRHLATLRAAGILSAEKQGREVYYQVRFPEIAQTLRSVANAIEACCGPHPNREEKK